MLLNSFPQQSVLELCDASVAEPPVLAGAASRAVVLQRARTAVKERCLLCFGASNENNMKTELKLKVKKLIEREKLIERGEKVVLGLSGGPDSICLLDILCSLKDELGFELSALHVNHMIRGAEADADEKFLKEYCEKIGVEFKSVKLNVPEISQNLGKTEEETGRDLRIEELKKQGADKIALAHNKNDQAETVLMRILRGTGTAGLSAMSLKRDDGIIRPLLETDRAEIEDYVTEHKLPARIDKTNFETDYTRNKIRLDLLPKLKEYNPNVIDALYRLSESAKEDNKVLDALAKDYIEQNGDKAYNIKALAQLPDSIFSRVIVLIMEKEGLEEDIGAAHIKALRAAILKNTGGKTIEFPHNYKILLKNGKIIITKA